MPSSALPLPKLFPPNGNEKCLYWLFGTTDRKWKYDQFMFAKVGIANDPRRRLVTYRTHCPVSIHTGIFVRLPSDSCATELERVFLNDENLSAYRPSEMPKSEWHIVFGGPSQHAVFCKDLLGRFYLERLNRPELWQCRIEWLICPDASRMLEVPESYDRYLCNIETGDTSGSAKRHNIPEKLVCWARAEEQAEALI
jgi:hypothetical protein